MTGNPSQGVDILADLFIDTKNPTYIYNQGRCLEQNHKCEDAIERFREYLRKIGDGPEQDRAEAQSHIRECQTILGIKEPAGQAGLGGAPAAQPAPASEAPTTLPVASAAPAVVATSSPAPSDVGGNPGASLRTAGIVTAAVGVAGLATGVIFNVKYNSGIGDIEAKYDKSSQSSNEDNKTLAVVGYGVGAACIVGGAVLYYLGWNKARVVATPGSVAGSPGALVTGVF